MFCCVLFSYLFCYDCATLIMAAETDRCATYSQCVYVCVCGRLTVLSAERVQSSSTPSSITALDPTDVQLDDVAANGDDSSDTSEPMRVRSSKRRKRTRTRWARRCRSVTEKRSLCVWFVRMSTSAQPPGVLDKTLWQIRDRERERKLFGLKM